MLRLLFGFACLFLVLGGGEQAPGGGASRILLLGESMCASNKGTGGGLADAIESALGLANQEGTTVTLSYRGTDFTRAKERNRDKLQAAIEAGRIEALLQSEVR